MIAPRCTSCGRTVLELRGQFAFFDSFLVDGGEPPPDTAGAYHLPCLEKAGIGARWHAATVKSLVGVRRHTELGRVDGWVVVKAPQGEPLAVSPLGDIVSLRVPSTRAVAGGLVATLREREYNLELQDAAAIAKLASALRAKRSMPLAEVYAAIGIADCLVHPELQTDAAFLHEDPDLEAEWTKQFVSAAVTYGVFLPESLAPYVARTGN